MGSEDSIRIRTAIAADADAIARLSAELGYETSSNEVQVRVERLLQSDEHAIFVAVDHAEVVHGWVHVFINHRLMVDPFADLGGLVVNKEMRGLGIGYQLLLSAEDWANGSGLSKMRIRSKVSRERAHQFYSSKDYETIKSQKVFEKKL